MAKSRTSRSAPSRSPSRTQIKSQAPAQAAGSAAALADAHETRDGFLKDLLSQPTAPFREKHVVGSVTHELNKHGVPHFMDPIGNIVVGVSSKAEYLRALKTRPASGEPLRIFIAHMDHPGFHGVEWISPEKLSIKWHGGSPVELLDGAPVWLGGPEGYCGEGHLANVKLASHRRAIDTATVELPSDLQGERVSAQSLFGGFRFRAPFWRDGELIYTKAADDLIGVYSICTLALQKMGSLESGKKSKPKKKDVPPFIGLLTRGEEVGYIGAIGHFELGWIQQAKRDLLFISLETSRTLPGADIGKGPVVRLGDRYTVFSAGPMRVFTELAETVLPGKHQRRVMDGGTCEGTVAVAYGYPTVAISVPLGNYHNQSFQGGPDSAGPNGPAPEYVHAEDLKGLITLCNALLLPKLPWKEPFAAKRKTFKSELKRYRPLLKD